MNTYRPIRPLVLAVLVATAGAVGLLALVGTKPAQAAFPGENGKIAFTSNRDGHVDEGGDSRAEVYVMDSDGQNPTNLTNNPQASDTDPTFSPDGTKIAFASGAGDDDSAAYGEV